MPEFLAPGVFIEEVPSRGTPIEGVGTSTAGFVGDAERGPIDATLVTSWAEYTRRYGPLPDAAPRRYLGWAVRGFFENGGRRAFVARVRAPRSRTAHAAVALAGAAAAPGTVVLSAIGPGAWGRRLIVSIAGASRASPKPEAPDLYALRVVLSADGGRATPAAGDGAAAIDASESEVFDDLSLDPASANFIVTRVNAASALVRAAWDPAGAEAPSPGVLPIEVALAGGEDGGESATGDYAGDNDAPGTAAQDRTGLAALAAIPEVSLLCVPDLDEAILPGLTAEVVRQCETLRDRFCVLHPGRSPRLDDMRAPADSSFGAVYAPWINAARPGAPGAAAVPPSGHVAGAYARSDAERGVHSSPASEALRGLAQGLSGVTPLDAPITRTQQHTLDRERVNWLRDLTGTGQGVRVWGARTMSTDPELKHVSIRRLLIYLEQSIERGTRWVALEPNGPRLWSRVLGAVSDFLVQVWRDGALTGARPQDAFFVKCDRATMTQNDLDSGRLVCVIGIAPVKPAEFVIFRIGQWTAGAAGRSSG
jgi:phage tail sheath protein FI